MSLTGQTTLSTDNVKLIIDALADYTKETRIDLSKNPFAAKLEQSASPDAILQLLEEREKAFKQFRDRKRTLISCLNPAVKVLHRFSGILREAVGQVSHTSRPHMRVFQRDLVRFPSLQQPLCLSESILSSAYVPPVFISKFPVIYDHARLPVMFHQAMTPSPTSLSMSGVSSSAWTSIPTSHLPR
jgi:hypothetical protein